MTSPSFQADVNMQYSDDDMTTLPTDLGVGVTQPLLPDVPLICASVGQMPVGTSRSAQAPPSPRMQHSEDHLEAASQAVRLRVATEERSDKSTPATYERHVNSYINWWECYQAAEVNSDPKKTAIPAFPITAAKVTMFLDYTSTRPKVSVAPIHLYLSCSF